MASLWCRAGARVPAARPLSESKNLLFRRAPVIAMAREVEGCGGQGQREEIRSGRAARRAGSALQRRVRAKVAAAGSLRSATPPRERTRDADSVAKQGSCLYEADLAAQAKDMFQDVSDQLNDQDALEDKEPEEDIGGEDE